MMNHSTVAVSFRVARGWFRTRPGIGLGGCAAGTGEDGVDRAQRVGRERDLEGAQRGTVELAQRARPDDRAGDAILGQEPRQRYGGRLLAEVGTQLLPPLELWAQLVDPLQRLR
jgi:hypothetical protein